MASPNDVPRVSEPIAAAGGYVTRAWVDFFLKLASSQSNEDLAALYQQLAARVGELEDGQAFNFQIRGQESIRVNGIPQQGGVVIISLQNDVTSPGNTSYYGTGPSGTKGWFPISGAFTVTSGDLVKTVGSDGVTNYGLANVADSGTGTLLATTFDAKGRKTGTKAATITGTASQIVVANGDASAGLPTISLADLANSGVGAALVKITRDTKGRIAGTQAATTDDLTEGSANLYFTNARADARITLQKAQPNGLASLDASGKLEVTQLPALAITETFVVPSQAAMLALVAQQGDVAVRTDLSKSFILTASPASTLSNWQELLSPTGMSGTVTSVGTGTGLAGGPITVSGTVALNSASIASLTLADSAVQPATLTAGLATKQNNPGSWTTPTLINGFADLGSPFNPSGYRSATNRVDIRGVVASASHTSSPILFTLPVGLRPVNRTIRMTGGSFPTIGFVVTRIDIYPNGDVQLVNPVTTTTNFVVLDGISFEL